LRKARLRAQIERLEAELDAARPYLALAREIQAEVHRASADGTADVERLTEALDAIPRRERVAVARAVFDGLDREQQWGVLERIFDDEELRRTLHTDRDALVEAARRSAGRNAIATSARSSGQLDTRLVPEGETLTLGMFRERDVHAAVPVGHSSTTCARRVVLRATDGAGTFQVIEDVFNPAGGYFVTPTYDEDAWRTADRLPAHALARVGSMTGDGDTRVFAPILFVGGRVDVETGGTVREGPLHLGFAMVGDCELFSDAR